MKLIILTCICSLNILAVEDKHPVKSTSNLMVHEFQRRIVGGKDADIEDYPFMAYIKTNGPNGQYICGGTIIDATHILTAAHCVETCKNEDDADTCREIMADNFDVYVDSTAPGYYEMFHVDQVHVHPDFEQDSKEHGCRVRFDIAVLELYKPITFNRKRSPVTLPKAVDFDDSEEVSDSKTNRYIGQRRMCTVLGWGRMKENETSESKPKLQVAHIPAIDTASCIRYADATSGPDRKSYFCKDTHICTMDPNNEAGICFGDSGGPLICGGEQVGVASIMVNCSGPNMPSGFTRTDINIEWLDDITKMVHWYNGARIFRLNNFILFLYCLIVNALQ